MLRQHCNPGKNVESAQKTRTRQQGHHDGLDVEDKSKYRHASRYIVHVDEAGDGELLGVAQVLEAVLDAEDDQPDDGDHDEDEGDIRGSLHGTQLGHEDGWQDDDETEEHEDTARAVHQPACRDKGI